MFNTYADKIQDRSRMTAFTAGFGLTFCLGFFLLPGLAYGEGGTGIIIAHLIASVIALPAVLSVVEMSSAMPGESDIPRYLTRSAGSVAGTVTAMAIWIWLVVVAALMISGMADYASVAVGAESEYQIVLVLILLVTAIAALGIGTSGRIRFGLFLVLLSAATLISVIGIVSGSLAQVLRITEFDTRSLLRMSGILITGYAGVIYSAIIVGRSRSEKGSVLPVVLLITFLVLFVAVSLLALLAVPAGRLVDNLSALSVAGETLTGVSGGQLVTVLAMVGLFSSSVLAVNLASGTLASLGGDLVPGGFLGQYQAASRSHIRALVAGAGLIICVSLFEPLQLIKLAGSLQLLIIVLVCAGVIVLRESHVEWYAPMKPGPAYPWLHIAGIVAAVIIVLQLGSMYIAAVFAVVVLGIVVRRSLPTGQIESGSAVYHWFARLGEQQYAGLDRELRGILKEKGLREEDPFDEIIAHSSVLEADCDSTFETVVNQAALLIAPLVGRSPEFISESFLEGTRIGATPVTHGVALPHFRIREINRPQMVIVRSKTGLHVISNDPILGHEEEQDVNAVFFLISPEDDPGQHLRLLAQIAGRVDDASFMKEWIDATDAQRLREVLLRDDRFMSLHIKSETPSSVLIQKMLKEIEMPEGSLVAMIRRHGETLVPGGKTVLQEGDRLTIIGGPETLRSIRSRYVDRKP